MSDSARLSVRITAYLLVAVFALVILEVGGRIMSPIHADENLSSRSDIYRRLYSREELDRNQPLQLPRQGGECVSYRLDRLYWNQWWGYSSKILDLDCTRTLFSRHKIKVVLLGGSAMYNHEAPNYLTHIDYLAFNNDKRIASINLSESGARLSNMAARFIHEADELKPGIAVFLDGFNEFNSIRYGGRPGNDFYWTAGVKQRVENPAFVLVDRLIETSGAARLLLLQTGLVRSARQPRLAEQPSPEPDVRIYLRDREIVSALCHRYGIECIFILQPSAFFAAQRNRSAAEAVSQHVKYFPYDEQLYKKAYELLQRNGCEMCVNAANLLDDVDDAFFDVVHFTKAGGARLGSLILEQVLSVYERRFGRKR